MTSRTITVDISIDTRKLMVGFRSMARAARQIERNRATRPISPERREIQRLGRHELDAAVAWFQNHIAERTSS